MENSCRRPSDVGSHRLNFPEKSPHFFKIILSDILQDRGLRIPKMFMEKYGISLSNSVILKVPSGAEWQVELVNCNGRFWLQNGWQEFAEYYSIGYGHLLVFRYEGNSHFHVLIFDTSASEIEYPFNTTNREHTNLKVGTEDIDFDNSVEILEDFPACQTRREKLPVPYLQPCKKMRTNPTCKKLNHNGGCWMPKMDESERDDHSVEILDVFSPSQRTKDQTSSLHLHFSKMKNKPMVKSENTYNHKPFVPPSQTTGSQANRMKTAKSEMDLCSYCPMQEVRDRPDFPAEKGSGLVPTTQRCPRSSAPAERKPPASAIEIDRAFQKAKSFKSENPFVVITMQQSYLSPIYNMYIPRIFLKRYFTKPRDNVVLQVMDGRTWSAKYSIYARNASLHSGWNTFARDNYLVVGDVCVFELIKDTFNLLKVVIFRAVEEANCSQQSRNHEQLEL